MNYGCPKNHIDSKRFMFDWCGFKKVIVIEEDVVVSSHYIKTLLDFHAWAKKNYANVGIVQLWSPCFLSAGQKKDVLNSVEETTIFHSLVTYCLDRELWNAISSFLYEYEQLFIDPLLGNEVLSRSRSKPDEGIYAQEMKKWLVKKILNSNRQTAKKGWENGLAILDSRFNLLEISKKGGYCVNQDWITADAICLAGSIRLQTVVNRVAHIGKEGISTDPEIWYKYMFDKIVLDEFDEDATIEEFMMVTDS